MNILKKNIAFIMNFWNDDIKFRMLIKWKMWIQNNVYIYIYIYIYTIIKQGIQKQHASKLSQYKIISFKKNLNAMAFVIFYHL